MNKLSLFVFFAFIEILLIFSLSVSDARASDNNTEVLQEVVAGGISKGAENFASEMMEDSQLSSIGNDSNVNIFTPIISPIGLLDDDTIISKMESTIPTFSILAKWLVLIITLFVILQIKSPEHAANISKIVNGIGTYYYPKDILKTGIKIGLWFLGGPLLFYAMIQHNNWILSGMDTSVLNEFVISSENLPNYFMLGVCSKGLKWYFSIREIILMISLINWYYLGLILSWKKIRWVGVLYFWWIAVQVYIQVIIVEIITETVSYVLNGEMAWYVDMSVYAAMNFLLLIIVFVAFTLPIWIKILSPATMRTLIGYARGF
ncbi:MAG: hypothetical protein ABFD07_03325 [Methanobacterium sp.]